MQKNSPLLGKHGLSGLRLWAVLLVVSMFPVPSGSGFQSAQPSNCVIGSLNSPVRLEVFSDFECPACRNFYMDVVTQAIKDYGRTGKICILYNEFPLNIHAYSRKAALYSLAAQRVGRRQWLAVIDALYTNQPFWSTDGSINKALSSAVSVDTLSRIEKLAQEPSLEDVLAQEIAHGDKMGIKSTPTIFVTSKNKTEKVERALPYSVWKDFFNDTLK
jgi:protein-disulfide isomerase